MATPEFIALKCDHCPNWMANGITNLTRYRNNAVVFDNHTAAYNAGREDGWYIAEVELCPVCAEAYAIEKSSEEEAE
jgi:hypothetical protein